MHDFSNRTLLLSGANGGIGREVARLFHSCGANLVLTDLDASDLASFAAQFEDGRVATAPMDAASAVQAQRAVDLAVSRFGGVDFVVPCAGLYQTRPFAQLTDDEWRRTMSINLDGVYYLCQRALPTLRNDSAIVNVASVAAHRGSFHHAHYSASKGALLSLTRSLALELGPRTRVNAVSPGVVETAMTEALIESRGAELAGQSAMKRLGRPAEIAAVIAFLCSSGASFITGEVIHVNGGIHMAG